MGLVVNGSGTSRQTGTSHAVGISDVDIGDYEMVVSLIESSGVEDIDPPDLTWSLVFQEYDTDALYQWHVWERYNPDGSTGALTWTTGNSIRVGLIRAAFTGDPGQPAAGPEQHSEAGSGAPLVTAAKTPDFPNGDSFVVAVLPDASWNQTGLGAFQDEGPSDTSSVAVNLIRNSTYTMGLWLLPEGDDPFQLQFTYGV